MKGREKLLKPTTIIPQHLYVHRNADRELRRSIEDMGRPAYVLVARQMGKTNLLVNAKRELETQDDVFVYLDLTNVFEDMREFLRGVIDIAIDTHSTLLDEVGGAIHAARQQQVLPAHKEHETELRRILRAIPGKFVIFLDEIDALTRSTFSDHIFSQIRKTYFSRVNFSEFGKLTYVLSGVAEPNDLIKDPKISPFNIGEKIYLSDFTHEEHLSFLQKAGLGNIPGEAAQRLFYWAGGNPRITWDICSALEDVALAGAVVTPITVDDTVRQIYLNSYDHAPVDHIRSLVQSDVSIRDAIVQIRYGKGNDLSDATKGRLYLAGIIGADVRSAQIKNKIVDESLSDQWLRDVERRNTDLLAVANARLVAGDYQASIGFYEDYLGRNPDAKPADVAFICYQIGLSYYALGKYRNAADTLASHTFDSNDSPEQYYGQLALVGACQLKLGEWDEAVRLFVRVMDAGEAAGKYRYEVLLNLASAYLRVDHAKWRDSIVSLCNEVLQASEAVEQKCGKSELDRLKNSAHIRLSKVYLHSNQLESARSHLEYAVEHCTMGERPTLLYAMARLESSLDKRRELLASAVKSLVDLDGRLVSRADETDLFDSFTAADMIAACAEVDPKGSFLTLLKHVVKSGRDRAQGNKDMLSEMLLTLAEKNSAVCTLVVNTVLEWRGPEAVDEGVAFDCLRMGALVDKSKGRRYLSRYLAQFDGDRRPTALDAVDLRILFFGAIAALRDRDMMKVRHVVGLMSSYLREDNESDQEGLLLVWFVRLRIAETEEDEVEQVACASRVDGLALRLAQGVHELPIVGVEGPPVFQDLARKVLRQARQGGLTKAGLGRNEWILVRYPDGSTARVKYKKAEADLLAGSCEFVRRVEKSQL